VPKTKDYYEVLGVPRTATPKEITSAFRKLARKHHPDLNAGDKQAEARFKEISQAHDVLSDAKKRSLFDEFGADWAAAEAGGVQPGASRGRVRQQPGGGGAQYRTVTPEEMADLFGDAGGGFWIGREALDAVHRAYDGRGPATALTPVIQRRFTDLESAYIELQTDVDWVRIVASFAREVVWLAEQDAVAAAICKEAGDHLAHSAATAVERIGEAGQPNPLISLVGGILLPGAVRDSCVAALQARWPAFVPFPANGSALDGAQALGALDPSHPLSSQVASASVARAV